MWSSIHMFSKKPFSGVNHVYFKQKLLNYDVVMEDYCVSLGNLIKLTLRKAWWHMIIIDELYFKFVEGEGFRFFFFFSQTQPWFKVSSYTIFITCCYEIFLEEQDKIKKFLKSNYNHRHMDLFAKNNSIFLISHFVDNNWKLHEEINNFYSYHWPQRWAKWKAITCIGLRENCDYHNWQC